MAAIPEKTDQLIDWFEENFTCFRGPARAYVEIPIGKGEQFRIIYESYALKARRDKEPERRLVESMYQDFAALLPLLSETTCLFWRLPERIVFESRSVQLYGEPMVSREAAEDKLIAVPEYAVCDPATGNWCVDGGKLTEWTLRTRLCIPEMGWVTHAPLATRKPEGGVTLCV